MVWVLHLLPTVGLRISARPPGSILANYFLLAKQFLVGASSDFLSRVHLGNLPLLAKTDLSGCSFFFLSGAFWQTSSARLAVRVGALYVFFWVHLGNLLLPALQLELVFSVLLVFISGRGCFWGYLLSLLPGALCLLSGRCVTLPSITVMWATLFNLCPSVTIPSALAALFNVVSNCCLCFYMQLHTAFVTLNPPFLSTFLLPHAYIFRN